MISDIGSHIICAMELSLEHVKFHNCPIGTYLSGASARGLCLQLMDGRDNSMVWSRLDIEQGKMPGCIANAGIFMLYLVI